MALVAVVGCTGRTALLVPLEDEGPIDGPTDLGPPPGGPPTDVGRPGDAGDPSDLGGPRDGGADDLGPADLGSPSGCAEGALAFEESFEAGFGRFAPDDGHWALVREPNRIDGPTQLNGRWSRSANGCPVTTAVRMTVDLDLSSARAPVLEFQQRGEMAFLDTVRVLLSLDEGRSWLPLVEFDALDAEWRGETVPLPSVPRTRIAFELENVCGDPLGIDWTIDQVRVCLE